MTSPTATVRVIDKHCGFGKTSELLGSFKSNQKYLLVVPDLGEVERVIRNATVPFVEPSDEVSTKRENLELLLEQGHNIVTTHALYKRVASLARQGKLSHYNIIIDEVPETCAGVNGKSPKSFQKFYLDCGYATVDLEGCVFPTQKWTDEKGQIADTLAEEL